MILCRVEGCGAADKYKAPQLCNRHYLRLRRHGNETAGGSDQGAALRWIDENIPARSDACLYWPFGRFADGYGAVQFEGQKARVHRLVCQRVHGEPEDAGMDAAHQCGRGHRGCVNDRHLYWATRAQNLADRVGHGTANRGRRNGQAKLDEAQAREILALKDSGVLQKEVAGRYGVSRELIGRIWRRQIWEWL